MVLAFEPDWIGTINCLKKSRRKARMDLFRYGVDVLSKLPNATIYLEGTASDWKPAAWTARMLRYMGVAKVRGFMLNVTHHDWTYKNVAYGRKVSRMVGGKPFVISTSYNGRGPVHYKLGTKGRYRRVNVFCNPRFRGLGPKPNTNTADRRRGRVPVPQPSRRLRRGHLQRRLQGRRVVARAGADVLQVRHRVVRPAQGHPLRLPAADLAVPPRRAGQGRAGLQLRSSPEKRCRR